jgi:DNA repair photolyase
MILSASRRTDIPAFYSEWFYNRVKEGFVYVRNPMNIHQISNIPINPNIVDCIVFWTKNPNAMLPRLQEIDSFNYYFQFTINPYSQTLETFVPKKEIIIDTFKKLSDKIGSNRIIWRYDPILLTDEISLDYHIRYFESIAKRIASYTNKCIVSFIDNYKKTERNMKHTSVRELTESEIWIISKSIAEISKVYNIEIQTCAEKYNLIKFGIKQGRCIDNVTIEDITGYKIDSKKDKNQRTECGCIESIDIGEYNTCGHNCLYCYANYNQTEVQKKKQNHFSDSPLLIGTVSDKDVIKDRCCVSFRRQGLFEDNPVSSSINKNKL